jgi:sarcosine oxidase
LPPFSAIVIGLGGVGSSALLHLARRGVKALGLDRFPPGHDRGSSHGQTRIIRRAYFEHPDYVPLVERAYLQWDELAQRTGQTLFQPIGLLQVGPADGLVLPGVLASARRHNLDVESLTAREVERRFPGFCAPDSLAGVYERGAGCLRVEDCVTAQLREAAACGAELHTDEAVAAWRIDRGNIRVETDRGHYTADRLIIAAGPWAGQLLADLGLSLEVRRKPQYWYLPHSETYRVERGCPAFLYETPAGIFYGFPQFKPGEGMKIAEHTGGPVVADPLTVNRDIDPNDQRRVEEFFEEYLPDVTRECVAHSVCMYTMTPDQHFIVDRHPSCPQVVFAAGLSGHGFKFTPILGEALVDLALEGRTELPISFLGIRKGSCGTA